QDETLFCGLTKPFEGHGEIPLNTLSLQVTVVENKLSGGMAMLRGLAQPGFALAGILNHTTTRIVAKSEYQLGCGVALLRGCSVIHGFAVPCFGFGSVLLDAIATGIAHAKFELRESLALFSSLAVPLRGLKWTLVDAYADL